VRDPRHFVQVVHQVLRPGGVIFIATPSLDSWSARMMSTRWMEFKPEHLSYFSRKSLEGLLFSEGFRTLAWQPGYKILNYDYIQEHFEKFPTPFFTTAVKAVGACLPAGLRAREGRIVASGMVMMGRRAEKPARPRLSIIMPVFNEIGTFRSAFTKLLAHPFPSFDVEYIVVESNSTDGTRAIVNQFAGHPGVRVILEERPRGKGHAVRTGLNSAQGDFVAIQDADLEYDLDDYDALLDPLLHNREAFVLGARHGGRAWKMRQFTGQPIASVAMNFGHWFFTTLLNLCYFVRLRDPFTMYKIFRRDCIHGLPLECNRFDFDWEIVIKLIRRGYVPVEIPVNYRSRSFKEGKKVSVIRDPLTWLRALVRFRFVRLPRWAEPVAQPAAVNPEPATFVR
jgi:glycosyltransferase involved in cell wall biosynthesis